MKVEDQEADLTLWADGVALELDRKDRPELAAVFRALARRDADAIEEALDLFARPMLDALAEMIHLERRDRSRAGQERAVEILSWLAFMVEEAEDRRGPDLGPKSVGPVQ